MPDRRTGPNRGKWDYSAAAGDRARRADRRQCDRRELDPVVRDVLMELFGHATESRWDAFDMRALIRAGIERIKARQEEMEAKP